MNYKYRKKTVVVEAFQMTYERRWDNADWPVWLHQAWQERSGDDGSLYINKDAGALPAGEKIDSRLCIGSLDGPLRIRWGDYIVRVEDGTLYLRAPDDFERTHDAVEAENMESGDETAVVTPFDRAIGAVLGEREYQERLWGPTEMQGKHNVTEFLVFIQDYVTEALHIQSRIASPHAENKTRHSMRKIASLAIACMEQNGVASRDITDLQRKREDHKA